MIANAIEVDTQKQFLKANRAEDILPLVYEQLRQLAESKLANEAFCHSMQATALVHEVYLRLTERDPDLQWNGRSHFFGAAAIAMRRLLVERARKRKTLRRGKDFVRQPLTELDQLEAHLWNQRVNILDLNDALEKLAEHNARQARLVELRFLLGMTNKEAAEVLRISSATADLDWRYARSYLQLELSSDER
ncbi:MAG: ECF-type sigma factor [Planctomycetota bacterium]|nr:ECF-type sigma factor [Planctomycetota bacterium]